MNRFFGFILGISLFGFGFGIILNPKFYDSKHAFYYDFTEVRVPFGGLLIIIGILFVWLAVRKKAKEFGDKFLICPKCRTPFNQKDVPEGKCSKCDVELEDLEGFYERHPELKVRNNKPGRLA